MAVYFDYNLYETGKYSRPIFRTVYCSRKNNVTQLQSSFRMQSIMGSSLYYYSGVTTSENYLLSFYYYSTTTWYMLSEHPNLCFLQSATLYLVPSSYSKSHLISFWHYITPQ